MPAPSLKTWSARPILPDGEASDPTAARALVNILATAAAVAGLLLLLTTERVGWGLAVLAGAVVLAVGRAAAAQLWRQQLLGADLLVRLTAVVGVALAHLQQRPADGLWVWPATILLLLTTLGEPLVDKLHDGGSFTAAHVPGLPEPARPRLPGRWVTAAATAALVAGGVLAALGLPAWAWLCAAGVAALLALVAAGEGVRSLLVDRRVRRRLERALADYQPEFIVYAGRQEDASYQVTMWSPYLQRTGRRFVVMTRHPLPGASLADQLDVPVVCCRTLADLEAALVPSVTTVFYPNAASANGHMVRYSHLTHVHLGHGDSDKATSYNPLHAMYDKVFSAGQAAMDRYAKHGVLIPRERFSVVGRPQVEDVQRTSTPISQVDRPAVLYAPTWRGHVDETRLYSLPHGERIVRALLERGATVVFRPHPFNLDIAEDAAVVERINQLLRADAARSGRQHRYGDEALRTMSVFDCFNASDAMIADVSSVVSDYLYSGKPLAMYSIGDSPEQFVADFPVAEAAYLVDPDLTRLDDVLEQLLGADPRRTVRESMREYYLGSFPDEGYSDVFVREAERVIAGGGRTRDPSRDDVVEGDDRTEWAGTEAADADTDDDAGDDTGTTSPLDAEAHQGLDTDVPAGASGTGGATMSTEEVAAGLPALTSALAVVSALAPWPDALTAVLVVLTLAPLTWSGNRGLRRPRSSTDALGAWLPARWLAAIAVVALATRRSDPSDTMVWILAGALLLTMVGEAWVRTARRIRRLRVRHLRTLDYKNPRPTLQGWMFLLGTAPLWLALVLAVAGVPVWFATAVALEGLAVAAYMLVREHHLVAAHWKGTEELRGAIEQYAPEFVVYFAAKTGADYQVGMWMPYFERIGRRFIVVTRYDESLVPLAELTRSPVVLCRTLGSLEDTTVPSVRAAFYVNNGLTNTHYVEHRELTHVWLNHGDSEKPACFNPVHGIYDRIYAAGQAGVDRYARHGVAIPQEKFEIVGRPQVSGILPAPRPIREVSGPTVLYAPTWIGPYEDTRFYSLPQGARIVRALLDRGCTVVFRAHPLNHQFPDARELMSEIHALLDEDRARTGRDHRFGDDAEKTMDVKDCFNASDAMISDVSAVVTDYLQSQKPFAMVAAESNSEKLIREAPVAVASYPLMGDLSNLDEVLDNLLRHDPLERQREATRDYYLGDFDVDDPAQPFLRAARRQIDEPTPEHDALATG